MPLRCKKTIGLPQLARMGLIVLMVGAVFISLIEPSATAQSPDPIPELAQNQEDGATLPSPGQFGQRFRRRQMRGDFPAPQAEGGEIESQGVVGPAPLGPAIDGPPIRGGFAEGQGRPGRQRGARFGGGRQFFGGPLDLTPLNLSEEQKQRIRQMRAKTGTRARELKQVLQSRRREMRDLMFDPEATDNQILAKRQDLRSLQDKLDEMLIGDFLSVRAALTPEQRKRLPEVKPVPRIPLSGGGGQAGRFRRRSFAGPSGSALD